jgi:hypothetical protein
MTWAAPLIKIAARPTATNVTLTLSISASPNFTTDWAAVIHRSDDQGERPESRYDPTAVFWSSTTGKPVAPDVALLGTAHVRGLDVAAHRLPAYISRMLRIGKQPPDSVPIIVCAVTVAFLMPLSMTLSVAGGVAESPPPFAGFAPGREGKEQQKEWRDALDAAADKPEAPPRQTIERMKREPPHPGETMNSYIRRLGIDSQSKP